MSRTGWAVAAAGLLAAALALLAPAAAPYALAFLAAAVFALRLFLQPAAPLSPERLARAVLFLFAGVGLLVPALVGVVHVGGAILDELTQGAPAQARRDLLLLAPVLALAVLAARLWPARWRDGGFLLLTGLAVVFLKLFYVHRVQMEPTSDFGEMWKLTSRVAEAGPFGIPAELLPRIYLERILPYLLPLRLLFGPEASSYAVANVLAEAATSLLVFALTRKWFGRPAARAAFVLSLLAVETWLAAEIPTHDIPGALYTTLGLVLFVQLHRLSAAGRLRPALAASFALGLVALAIDLQRTTGLFFLLSCGVVGLAAHLLESPGPTAGGRRFAAAVLLLLVLPFATFELAHRSLAAAGLTVPPEIFAQRRGMVLAAGSESWSDGGWAHLEYDYVQRYGAVPVKWYRLSLVRLASDTFYTPSARLTAYLRKSLVLFDLGSQTYFYAARAKIVGGGEIGPDRERRLLFASRCFTFLFLVGFLLGCWELWRLQGPPLLSFLPLLYLSLVSALLIFCALVQPRYIFQIWYFGAIYAGLHFGGHPPEPTAAS